MRNPDGAVHKLSDVDFFLEWDGRAWGIDHTTGDMFYFFVPGTEISVAPVPVKGGDIRTGYVYRTITG